MEESNIQDPKEAFSPEAYDDVPGPEFWTLERLAHMGLLEPFGRILFHVLFTVTLLGAVVFFRYVDFPNSELTLTPAPESVALAVNTLQSGDDASEPEGTGGKVAAMPPFPSEMPVTGIRRALILETDLPRLQRTEPITYEVRKGDTLSSIAERFGLKVETIFWSNVEVLDRDPHNLKPGMKLTIPPQDGVLYEWQEGDTLQEIAEKFQVEPEAIVDYPSNNLDPSLLMDEEASKNIEPGTLLFIPGAKTEDIDWTLPRFIRERLAFSRLKGPGECGPIGYGPIGTYTFIWPTTVYRVSQGFSMAHPAIDIPGAVGLPIFAVDHGVVVYAGWHNGGYGYVVVVDHGNGWQSLYAHLSSIIAGCGTEVFQGQIIGSMGNTGRSTGPHVHLELMHQQYGKVNPLQFLPIPGK